MSKEAAEREPERARLAARVADLEALYREADRKSCAAWDREEPDSDLDEIYRRLRDKFNTARYALDDYERGTRKLEREAARQTEPTPERNDCIVCSRQIENEGDPVCSRCQCDKCNREHDDEWREGMRLCEVCARWYDAE